ncbi:BglG family transcription antiterminator [Faecalicoccus sp. LCP19S3_E3]|uniref:BglG family transcription antiterminator n=1 Tax=unclassified Faecalicoccus TaxID=2643311 RepID=UPI003F918361
MEKKYELSQRIIDIINCLSDNEKAYTVKQLASQYNVTVRTIYNDLKSINQFLYTYGFKLLIIQSDGRIIPSQDFFLCRSFLKIDDFYYYRLSRHERVIIAAAMIMLEPNYITISQIADTLYFSRTTIVKDLPDIRKFLSGFSLTLQTYPNKGLHVEGLEINIRNALTEIFNPESLNHELSNYLLNNRIILSNKNIKIIDNIISEIEMEYQINFSDQSFHDLRYFLIILIDRNANCHYISRHRKVNGEEYHIAKDILRYICQYCKIHTTEAEAYLLALKIKNEIIYQSTITNNKESIAIQVCARKLISDVSKSMHIDLTSDYQLYENLSNHLTSIYNQYIVTYIDNPVISDIQKSQKKIVDAVSKNIKPVENFFGRTLTNKEIIYIVIHFCAAIERYRNSKIIYDVVVICNAGVGTSEYIAAKLKKMYHLNIASVISSHQISKLKKDSADFLISTIPIQNAPIDFIVISSLLNEEDYRTIGNKIAELQARKHTPIRQQQEEITAGDIANVIRPILYNMIPDNAEIIYKEIKKQLRSFFNHTKTYQEELTSPYLHQLLSPNFIQLNIMATDWIDAIRKSAMPLLEHGYIEQDYISNMIENAKELGPYFCLMPGLAIPHASLESGSYKTGMNMIRLEKPIIFNSPEVDPIKYVITLSAVDNKTHLKALFHLLNLFQNEEFRKELDNANSSLLVNQIIEKYEYILPDN